MKPQVISIGGKNLDILKQLGKGTYGSVFLVNIQDVPKAVKIITNEKLDGVRSLIEIDVMSKLIHPNLVHAEGIMVGINGNVTVGIIMPLAVSDLQKSMVDPMLGSEDRIKILWDITNGLDYLHKAGYLHMDLKPMNVLIFNNNQAKLTDFGLSLIMENEKKYYPNELVTITHRAPEILNGDRNYTKASDIWSLGIIFLEVMSGGKVIYKDIDRARVKAFNKKYFSYKMIDTTLKAFLPSENSVLTELIRKMLDYNYIERIGTDEIMSSPFFQGNYKGNLTYNQGAIIYKMPLEPRKCDLLYYFGFDYLVRLCMNFPVGTETVFLAGDIYQRSLAYANKLTGDFSKDWPNIALMATTSLYMAIKMIEPYYPDPRTFTKLALGMFTSDDILRVEAALVQMFEGIIYQKNLFTESHSKNKLLLGFEALRNCHIYHLIDLNEWDIHTDTNYLKYNKFGDFIKDTQYYKLMTYSQEIYLTDLFDKDLR